MAHTHGHEHEMVTLVDEQGNETLFEILLTIDGREQFGKNYVLLVPAGAEEDEAGEIETQAYSFTENEDGKIYVELRSSKYNINKIAVKYGGGGHTLASGATVDNWRMCESVIDDLIKLAEEGEKDV